MLLLDPVFTFQDGGRRYKVTWEGAALRGRATGTWLIDGQPVSLGHLQFWALGAHSKYTLQWDSGLSWQVLGAEPGQSQGGKALQNCLAAVHPTSSGLSRAGGIPVFSLSLARSVVNQPRWLVLP